MICIVVFFCGLSESPAWSQEASRLSVGSLGNSTRIPDRAWIRFTVAIEAKTPGEAAALKGLLDQLRAKGITSKNLQTAALSLQPKYEVKQEGAKEIRGDLLGYVAAKSIVATLEDVTAVASYIREFPLAGSMRISDVGFFSTEIEKAQSEALIDAIHRAQQAAQAAVTAAGRQLGPVSSMEISIQNEVKGPPQAAEPVFTFGQREAAFGARLIAEPGEQQFNQNVNLQWQLR
jgi:uncharacterized protein YggE